MQGKRIVFIVCVVAILSIGQKKPRNRERMLLSTFRSNIDVIAQTQGGHHCYVI